MTEKAAKRIIERIKEIMEDDSLDHAEMVGLIQEEMDEALFDGIDDE